MCVCEPHHTPEGHSKSPAQRERDPVCDPLWVCVCVPHIPNTTTTREKALWILCVCGPKEQWAGMANRQVRARFYCHGLEVFLGGGDTSQAIPPGFEPVNPLGSSRFLLMQTHVGYRLA